MKKLCLQVTPSMNEKAFEKRSRSMWQARRRKSKILKECLIVQMVMWVKRNGNYRLHRNSLSHQIALTPFFSNKSKIHWKDPTSHDRSRCCVHATVVISSFLFVLFAMVLSSTTVLSELCWKFTIIRKNICGWNHRDESSNCAKPDHVPFFPSRLLFAHCARYLSQIFPNVEWINRTACVVYFCSSFHFSPLILITFW